MQSNLNDQYQTISNWGIIKNLHQYNDVCQVIKMDDAVGDGYFENYRFDSLNLARLNCKFHNQQTLTSANSRHAYWIYILLQGKYQMYSVEENKHYELLAPAILLLKGELGELTANIPADSLINSLYIEFDKNYFSQLQELQNNPHYQQSILRHFFHQNEPYCFIPLTVNSKAMPKQSPPIQGDDSNLPIATNPLATKIIEKSWKLYKTPIPTDEMSLMLLQGETYSFVSELLLQSFSKLYMFNLQMNQTNTKADNQHSLYAVQAKLLLDQFYYENWTIRQLAKRVHTNECYLKKDFKILTGQTIGGYRKQKRMQQAVILLDKEFKTIEIANQLGFNSHDYFLKTFRKFYHCSPQEYLAS